jgi:hypothetical protein
LCVRIFLTRMPAEQGMAIDEKIDWNEYNFPVVKLDFLELNEADFAVSLVRQVLLLFGSSQHL